MNPLDLKKCWSFHNPAKIHFGPGCLSDALNRLPYRNILFVTSGGMRIRGTVQATMDCWQGVDFHVFDKVKPNPTIQDLDDAVQRLPRKPFDAILALGGGSVVDTAKVLSVLLACPEGFTLNGHFHHNIPLPANAFLPVIAVPTTSGTGSEVTPFATVWDSGNKKKYSLSASGMIPQIAVLDPSLTYDLPWEITLSTGLDALCQAMESIWNRNANSLTIGIALQAAKLSRESLIQGTALLSSSELRTQLMEASLLAGLAISQTRTALCHSMSYPITAHFGVPHGLACGVWLPKVLAYNAGVDDGRLAKTAAFLGFDSINALIEDLSNLLKELGAWEYFHQFVPDIHGLLPFAQEMLTPGRSDNNMRMANSDDISLLITKPLNI